MGGQARQCQRAAANESAKSHEAPAQPWGLYTRRVEPGLVASAAAGLRGLVTSSPPQFGHFPPSLVSAQEAQKVHSKEQIRATDDSGGRSRSQHSQFGRSSSI